MSTTSLDLRRSGVATDPGTRTSLVDSLKRATGGSGDGGDAGHGADPGPSGGRSGGKDDLTRGRLLQFGGVISALIILAGLVALWGSRTQVHDFEMAIDDSANLAQFEAATVDIEQVKSGLLEGLLAGSLGDQELAAAGFESSLSNLDTTVDRVNRIVANAEKHGETELLAITDGVLAAVAEYDAYVRPILEDALAGTGGALTGESLAEGTAQFGALYDAARASIDVGLEYSEEHIAEGKELSESHASRNQTLMIGGLLLALGAFVFIGRKVLKAVERMRVLQADNAAAQERERAQAQELQDKVNQMLDVIAAAADGDLTREVPVRGEDAIGQMGEALSRLLTDWRTSVASLATNSEALAAAAEELQVVSEQMGANSAETSSQVALVTSATVEVSNNVETVSAGAEEMSASIKEIAKNASEAAKVAGQAVDAAASTNATVSKLGDSSAEIGEIVKVITSIAQQTNLLALNATIEAARAGEAGKGFAVVANEVKELAKETAKATEDISRKIEAIQDNTRLSVEAIEGISGIIDQIAEFQGTIASAVEQQAATTSEIARSVTDASRGSTEITANMQAVSQAADSTAAGASDSQRAATELARMAADMQGLVGRFTY